MGHLMLITLVASVNLIGLRITTQTHFWVSLSRCFYKELTDWGRPTLQVGWGVRLDKRETRGTPAFIKPPWLRIPREPPFLTHSSSTLMDGLYLHTGASTNPSFLTLLLLCSVPAMRSTIAHCNVTRNGTPTLSGHFKVRCFRNLKRKPRW